MALDFHRQDNNTYLFGLDDVQFNHLICVFEEFKNRCGIDIDPYGDSVLIIAHQKTLISIIDSYIDKSNLNLDKQKTITILEFRALINHFYNQGIVIKIKGD